MDHAAGDACTAATQRRRSVGVIIAAGMDHDRARANLLHSKMSRGDSLGRIAPTINHQHRQVAAMAGGAERAQMLFGGGGIVVAAGGEACGRFALIHRRPAVALVMNMKPVLPGRQAGELGRDHQALGAVHKTHRPQGSADASGTNRIDRGGGGFPPTTTRDKPSKDSAAKTPAPAAPRTGTRSSTTALPRTAE